MDEDISIINTNVKNEKIKNYFIKYKKKLFIILIFFILSLISYFSFQEYIDRNNVKISNKYNNLIIEYSSDNKKKTINGLSEIIYEKNPTYSPLSLYFIIDNNLVSDKDQINDYFVVLIEDTPLEEEIKNLIIYKMALYNADYIDENNLLKILNPLINSESVWKSHALYLAAEFFYSRGENLKAKDFYKKIVLIENSNRDIKIQAQRRLNRDLSD